MKRIQFTDQAFVPAGHEDPQRPGVWKKVLFQRDELQYGRVQMINWALLPAGNSFAAHYHQDMQEIFIVLAGAARIQVDQQQVILQRGDAVLIEPGEVHAMWNEGDEDVEYIALGIAAGPGGRTVLQPPE